MKPKRLATQNTTPRLNSQVSRDRKIENMINQPHYEEVFNICMLICKVSGCNLDGKIC